MILVDTSVWIDHFRHGDTLLTAQLEDSEVVMHPFVLGELAMGSIRNRETILNLLDDLPRCVIASHEEVLHFVDDNRLFGRGIGLVDAHILASTRLTPDCRLWTKDSRLRQAAEELSLVTKHSP